MEEYKHSNLALSIQHGKDGLKIKEEGDRMSTCWNPHRRLANKWVETELPKILREKTAAGWSHVQLGQAGLREQCMDMFPQYSFTSREIAGVKIHSKIIAAACITAGLPVVKRLFGKNQGCMPFMYAYNDYYIDLKAL